MLTSIQWNNVPSRQGRPNLNRLWALLILLLICWPNAVVRLTAHASLIVPSTTNVNAIATSEAQWFQAYQFFDDDRPVDVQPYSAHAFPFNVSDSCTLTIPTDFAVRLNASAVAPSSRSGIEANMTSPTRVIGYVSWELAQAANCQQYVQLVAQLPLLREAVNSRQRNPDGASVTLTAMVLATSASNATKFGGFDAGIYGSYRAPRLSSDVALLLTSRETIPALAKAVQSIAVAETDNHDEGKVSGKSAVRGFVPVTVVADRGPWNALLDKSGFKAQRWLFFSLQLLGALILAGKWGAALYRHRGHINRVRMWWGLVVLALVANLAIPLEGYLSPAQGGIHLAVQSLLLIGTCPLYWKWLKTCQQLRQATLGNIHPYHNLLSRMMTSRRIVALVSAVKGIVVMAALALGLGILLWFVAIVGGTPVYALWHVAQCTLLYAGLPLLALQVILFAVIVADTLQPTVQMTLTPAVRYAFRQFSLVCSTVVVGQVCIALALVFTYAAVQQASPALYVLRIVFYYLGVMILATSSLIPVSMAHYSDIATAATTIASAGAMGTRGEAGERRRPLSLYSQAASHRASQASSLGGLASEKPRLWQSRFTAVSLPTIQFPNRVLGRRRPGQHRQGLGSSLSSPSSRKPSRLTKDGIFEPTRRSEDTKAFVPLDQQSGCFSSP
ncbi:hypothetical protein H4R34_003787 [Dimargaris verticillata]|uniref:Uncharacterized protein n=1 Tax=Dimargaris verticillata TaxID=2761393 RepID=A0A9W8B3V5_9FUNG|nr:hypothetical protein H4R34_003787 [Dimargaris verticillata]